MTDILAQLVHEKEVLRNRVNMIEKDLTKARTTIDEQQRLIERLKLRVEKLEDRQTQLLNFINDLQSRVAKVESKASNLDDRTKGSIRFGI